MNIINFFDRERRLIMQFKDFYFNQDEVLQIVAFTGIINFDFFHLETNFEAEESDFRFLLSSLDKMEKGKQRYITFNPLQGKIIIKLIKDIDKINVEVEIYNMPSTCTVKFRYDIDQSFIPGLIEEIDMIMKESP